MKRRIVAALLVLTLAVGLVPVVSAAGHGMTDIVGHWAENDIAWTLDMGLFNGTSASKFNPNGAMTRGMFVTVLGRFAGIDPDDFDDWYLPDLYTDVNADYYYAPYINWAARYGITTGTGNGTFSPDTPITREQMATFLLRYANYFGYDFEPIRKDVPKRFSDESKITAFAVEAVATMRKSGIINGRVSADGSYCFDPQAVAVRSECAAVFHRLAESLVNDPDFDLHEPEDIRVYDYEGSTLMPGDTFRLEYKTVPANPSNDTILWISSDPSVLSVDANGTVTCKASGTAEIYAYTCSGAYDYATITVDFYIGYEGESYKSKCMHVFGKEVKNHRRPYGDSAPKSAYEENYVTVTVKVWDFKDKTQKEKVTKNRSFYIHKNLEATVRQCFQEIYECKEKFPINSIITYWSSGGNSEHNPGTAIDINYESNPYVAPDGTVVTGKKFDPDNDPYSIPVGGKVEQIFKKYGFTRGIYWKSGYKDYMHFSFFGT